MALGTEAASNSNSSNWREVVSAIKDAGKILDKEVDPQSLRYLQFFVYIHLFSLIFKTDFVRSLSNYKEQYAASKEVMREVLHQISVLKNSPYLQPYVFEASNDLSKPQGNSFS